MTTIAVTNVIYVKNGIHEDVFYQTVDDSWGVRDTVWGIPLSEDINELKKTYKWQDKERYPTYNSFKDAMSFASNEETLVGKKLATGDCVIKDMHVKELMRIRKEKLTSVN